MWLQVPAGWMGLGAACCLLLAACSLLLAACSLLLATSYTYLLVLLPSDIGPVSAAAFSAEVATAQTGDHTTYPAIEGVE